MMEMFEYLVKTLALGILILMILGLPRFMRGFGQLFAGTIREVHHRRWQKKLSRRRSRSLS